MKRLFAFLTLIIATSCGVTIYVDDFNRTVENFTYKNGKVTWSKVYNVAEDDIENVKLWLMSDFNIKTSDSTRIVGQTDLASMPLREAGLQPNLVEMMYHYPCVVSFIADLKDSKYRVIVTDIVWHDKTTTSYKITSNISYASTNETTKSLSDWATKGEGYDSVFYKRTAINLNKILTHMFEYKKHINLTDRDNW